MALRVLYTIFFAILISLFVGLGIAAFYPAPEAPDYPTILNETRPDTDTNEIKRADSKYNKAQKDYEEKRGVYARNVSIISLTAAIIILVLAFVFVNKKIIVLSDGLLLGGVLTLLYSIINGFGSPDEKFRFIVVTIGLIVAFVLGYLKFSKSEQSS